MLGREFAQRIAEQHGTNDPEAIAKAEGLEVRSILLWKARFEEFFVEPLILRYPLAGSCSATRPTRTTVG